MRDLFFALFILLVPHYAMSQQDTMIVSVNGVDFVMVRGKGEGIKKERSLPNRCYFLKITPKFGSTHNGLQDDLEKTCCQCFTK